MPRNYTLPTIKTLFAEASACAYPGCDEPLIFHDRGVVTVVAQIAHIRSEKEKGPRHDTAYTGDIDGPDNLILLCGKHHPPVDRHESIYSIEELEAWKVAQVAQAGPGTSITDEQAQAFVRLSVQESEALAQVARFAQRVVDAAKGSQASYEAIERDRAYARHSAYLRLGPAWEVHEDGSKTLMPEESFRLAPIDDREFDKRIRATIAAHQPTINEALNRLREEAAVLRMMGGASIGSSALEVVQVAEQMIAALMDDREAGEEIFVALSRLWHVANGSAED